MKQFKPVKVAVIGCGMISGIYLKNLKNMFNVTELVGCSDIIPERSKAKAEEFGIKQMTNEEIFADPEIEVVVNLTYHTSHFAVSKAALLAGKNVYSEKMMCITVDEAKELGRIAKEKGVIFCCAPDTFLGAGLQTARQIIDAGLIGTPVMANAIVVRGYHHERFKDTPERRFAFLPGGGIMYDMGCYYLQAMINILGPIDSVCGYSDTRDANSRIFMNAKNPGYGTVMKIETPNNVCGAMKFKSGAMGVIITSSESVGATNSFVIYGTKGVLTLNDPNDFTGKIILKTPTGEENEIPQSFAYKENSRGLGVADMCYAIRNNREPRCSYERAIHILEAGVGIMNLEGENNYHKMETTCTRAAAFESGIVEYPEMAMDI